MLASPQRYNPASFAHIAMSSTFGCRYRPGVKIGLIQKTLAFEDEQDCVDFLTEMSIVYDAKDRGSVDCKNSYSAIIKARNESAGKAGWAS